MRLSAVRMHLSGILVSNRGHLDTKALSYQEVFDLAGSSHFPQMHLEAQRRQFHLTN